MRNSLHNVFAASRERRSVETPWRIDRFPSRRLVWLFVVMALPVAAIALRLVQLQCLLQDAYIAGFQTTTERIEPIAAVDGSIYGSDGKVLAEDVERFDVAVHYRWLEEPPNDRWLRRQAIGHLSRKERRDRQRVDDEIEKVLAARRDVWRRLADLANASPERLSAERIAVQARVERIADSVSRRRDARQSERRHETPPAPIGPFWKQAWATLVETLTTPPEREEDEPLIVREELDHHVVLRDAPLEVRAEIESRPHRYPGVLVARASRRVYRDSATAPHVVGTRVSLTSADHKTRRKDFPGHDPFDYRETDRRGRTGVERAYDAHLHGLRGERRVVRNRYGEIVGTQVVRAPQPGEHIELTLHTNVQRAMENALEAALGGEAKPASAGEPSFQPAGGCVVAMDVQSGALLAAASAPRFDLGFSGIPDPQTWKTLLDDPRRPLFDRVTQMALPPGSVFKVVSALALLENPSFDADEKFDCAGCLGRSDRFRCAVFRHFQKGHGPANLSDALCQSCNVYFYQAADSIGPEPIVAWSRRLGLGEKTGVDLPFERSGNLPDPFATQADGKSASVARWHKGDTRMLAIGQSSLTTTPLQIVRMMAAIANGGYLVTPHAARRFGPQLADDELELSRHAPKRRRIPEMTGNMLSQLKGGLERVVADPQGTAYQTVRLDEIAIAGKTGTAEVGGGRPDHAWFAGYAPADRPRVAFVVVLEHAGSGGQAAGPITRRLVQLLMAEGVLEHRRVTMRE